MKVISLSRSPSVGYGLLHLVAIVNFDKEDWHWTAVHRHYQASVESAGMKHSCKIFWTVGVSHGVSGQ